MNKSYKDVFKVHTPSEFEAAWADAEAYLRENEGFNYMTGEIKQYFPDICRSKKYKKTELSISEQKLLKLIGKPEFYTLVLADYRKSWARYDAIFIKADEIKALVKKVVKGPFIAVLEVSAYSGGHVHIICQKQNHRLLKAKNDVYDYLGLNRYFAKSPINYKDKAAHPEIYKAMVGFYLQAKAEARKKGKRLSKRKFSRLSERE